MIAGNDPSSGKPEELSSAEASNIEGSRAEEKIAVTELIVSRINGRLDALLVPGTNPTDDIVIAQDYLRQHQDKSITQLAEAMLASTSGFENPNPLQMVAPLISRLSVGRTIGPKNEFEYLLKFYCSSIEEACAKLELPLHSGIAAGIVWDPVNVPAQKAVLTTNASVIVIPEWTLMLCHFICKILSHALPKGEAGDQIGVSHEPDKLISKIRSTPTLRKYASGFFAYCATHDRSTLRRLKNATGIARPLWIQLLMATELFIVAHEYGHDIALHRTDDPVSADGAANNKIQELEADHLAALICGHAGAELRLPFAHSGCAGVIALVGTDLVRRARSVLVTGTEAPFESETHPPLEDRLMMLETLRYHPKQIEVVRAARQNFNCIMEGLWELILPDLQKMHRRGIRPLPLRSADIQWLPFWG